MVPTAGIGILHRLICPDQTRTANLPKGFAPVLHG